MTLTEFLFARVGEDEQDALAAVDDEQYWLHVGNGSIIQGNPGMAWSSSWLQMSHRIEAADHVTRWDPARVLAECKAKRAILNIHADARPDDGPHSCVVCGPDVGLDGEYPCGTLLALGAPYADHPDFDPAWAVTDTGETQ